MEGLDAKPQKGGRNLNLPEEKLPELEELLLEGAEAHGFETDLWTLPWIATLIEDEFDVSVSTSSTHRYLQKFDWTNQKPQRRAAERDEEEIEHFRTERIAELKKSRPRRTNASVYRREQVPASADSSPDVCANGRDTGHATGVVAAGRRDLGTDLHATNRRVQSVLPDTTGKFR